eukprot:gene53120-28777_t
MWLPAPGAAAAAGANSSVPWFVPPLPYADPTSALVVVQLRWGSGDRKESNMQWKVARVVDECDDPVVGTAAGAMPDGGTRAGAGLVEGERCRRDRCPIGALITASVREYMEHEGHPVDIVLINGGAMYSGWPEGNISLSDIFAARIVKLEALDQSTGSWEPV